MKSRLSSNSRLINNYANDDDMPEEEDDEDVIKQILQREKDILSSMSTDKALEKINLNKLNNKELTVVKKVMDGKFQQNRLLPGDPNYKYEINKDFNPEESNEWDKSKNSEELPSHRSQEQQQPAQIIPPTPPPAKENKPVEKPPSQQPLEHTQKKSGVSVAHKPALAGADEEFDIDFDEDFNDDLDDFD